MVAQGPIKNVLQAPTLEHVFKIPCQIRRDDLSHHLRVDFYPPDEAETSQMPEMVQFKSMNPPDKRYC